MVTEDLDARAEKERGGEIVDKFGLETRKKPSWKWVQCFLANDQLVVNIQFQEHPRRFGGERKNESPT